MQSTQSLCTPPGPSHWLGHQRKTRTTAQRRCRHSTHSNESRPCHVRAHAGSSATFSLCVRCAMLHRPASARTNRARITDMDSQHRDPWWTCQSPRSGGRLWLIEADADPSKPAAPWKPIPCHLFGLPQERNPAKRCKSCDEPSLSSPCHSNHDGVDASRAACGRSERGGEHMATASASAHSAQASAVPLWSVGLRGERRANASTCKRMIVDGIAENQSGLRPMSCHN